MPFLVIIPARYGSTRLPGKPLAAIAGRPMIAHVAARALESGARRVIVATDDERIAEAVTGTGAEACLTAREHASGTDRIAEAVDILNLDDAQVVVNLQGDEPLMPPKLIREVAAALESTGGAHMATACHPTSPGEIDNPDVVKVVRDAAGLALYFSRAPIPYPRSPGRGAGGRHQRHIGIYAYRAGFIRRFAAWPPCGLEQVESLEQLRALWHGCRIVVVDAEEVPASAVDTAEDLERVRKYLED